MEVAELVMEAFKLKSKNEARRLIKQGAVRINDDFVVIDPFAHMTIIEVDGKWHRLLEEFGKVTEIPNLIIAD